MAETDMVNGILLAGNLVFWGALFLYLHGKDRAACGGGRALGTAGAARVSEIWGWATAESAGASFAEALAGILEFAVYGAGMIRLTDLILRGIAGPGGESRTLLGVRILFAESMLFLFPLRKMSHRWKMEESSGEQGECRFDRDSYCEAPFASRLSEGMVPGSGFQRGWKGAVLEEGEGILGMLLLLGLTLQGWQEPDPIRALGRQAWLLLLFFCYGYLRRRRRVLRHLYNHGMAGEVMPDYGASVTGISTEAYRGSGERLAAGSYGGRGVGTSSHDSGEFMGSTLARRYGRENGGMPSRGYAGNADQIRRMEYLKNVELQYQRTRELWHDLKNHIKVLEILAQEERFGELTDYLDSFRQDVERRMIPAVTGCAPVDALLGDKLYQAKRQDVEMSLQLCRLSQTGIEAVDLCVILGNLLDNALEACARLEGHGRIGLSMRQEEAFYYITVVNTSGEPRREGGSYVSGKRGLDNRVGHGLGLRSAQRIAHRYGGQLAADYSDGEFRVVVRLEANRE